MTNNFTQPTLQQVISWAKAAGEIARAGFHQPHELGFKGATDVVTEIDHACEKLILGEIRSNFPSHSILAEESGSLNSGSEHCWYVDPLDGTINYAHRIPLYAISIAYARAGKVQLGVVYDPTRDECFSAERGKGAWLNGESLQVSDCSDLHHALLATGFPYHNQEKFRNNLRIFGELTRGTQGVRRLGCAALEVCYIACGRMDGYWEQEINAWDIAAGTLIAEEAGASVTDIFGGPDYFKPPYAVLAAAPGIHAALLEALKE
jgi:myo-inositol-1(or 4)-monophosphatase